MDTRKPFSNKSPVNPQSKARGFFLPSVNKESQSAPSSHVSSPTPYLKGKVFHFKDSVKFHFLPGIRQVVEDISEYREDAKNSLIAALQYKKKTLTSLQVIYDMRVKMYSLGDKDSALSVRRRALLRAEEVQEIEKTFFWIESVRHDIQKIQQQLADFNVVKLKPSMNRI